MKKKPNKEEREWLQKVSQLPCCVCNAYETEVHHCRINTGFGLRPSHYDTISLCVNHHRGQEGIHTLGRRAWENKYTTQQELIERTRGMLDV